MTVGHVVEILSALGVLLAACIVIAGGLVVMKSGVTQGWRESAKGWRERADELAAEVQALRAELADARERIAVLETRTDLTPILSAIETHNAEAANRYESSHRDDLERHEKIVEALQRIIQMNGGPK